jgi:hypothetical protein
MDDLLGARVRTRLPPGVDVGYRANLEGMWPLGWLDLGFVLLEEVFFATSRDTLRLCG